MPQQLEYARILAGSPVFMNTTPERIAEIMADITWQVKHIVKDEMVALALTRSGELWVERQPRGEAEQVTLLIPLENAVVDDVLGVYLFCKRADGSKVSKSVYVQLV